MNHNAQSNYIAISQFICRVYDWIKKHLTLPWGSVGSLYALNENCEMYSLFSPKKVPLIPILSAQYTQKL